MIIRARPRYYSPDQNISASACEPQGELFFDRGRSALKFLLLELSYREERPLKLAMQSFNCEAVMEAALQAQCQVFLYDINLEDLSGSVNNLEHLEGVDVLLLTHYQGIPCRSYSEVRDFCDTNHILLIDDLAQTEVSSIAGIEVGQLADFAIKSYAFDKPCSCLRGGSLVIENTRDGDLKKQLASTYSRLPAETEEEGTVDLDILNFLYNYTASVTLKNHQTDIIFLERLVRSRVPLPLLRVLSRDRFAYLATKFLFKVWDACRGRQLPTITIRKLAKSKIPVVLSQRNRMRLAVSDSAVERVKEWLQKRWPQRHREPRGKIKWNRYSILDESGQMANALVRVGVQAGNFNWPTPLHLQYKNQERVVLQGYYKNTEFAARHIVNIPLWTDFTDRQGDL